MKYVTNRLNETPPGWWIGTDFIEVQPEDVGKVLGIIEDEDGNPAYGLVPNGGGGGAVNSVNGQTGTVVLDADDVSAQSPFMTATITIATTDWNNGSCTKTVTGMTADSLVFVKYSDTETEFTEAQDANSMTFTAATTPSEAVTVYVAWFKEVANS